ncbi:MAG: EthD domain-containing protein [Acidimicrobiia bacterium]|nr:EthD domain-containing protein [Acidimicrobiia bacterium]
MLLVFCVRRRPDVAADEFHRYWRDEHGPLVRSLQPAMGIVRYVQAHRLETPINDLLRASRSADAAYDGVAQLWWRSQEHFVECLATPESQAASLLLLEDETRFIDLTTSSLFVTEEVIVVDGSSDRSG